MLSALGSCEPMQCIQWCYVVGTNVFTFVKKLEAEKNTCVMFLSWSSHTLASYAKASKGKNCMCYAILYGIAIGVIVFMLKHCLWLHDISGDTTTCVLQCMFEMGKCLDGCNLASMCIVVPTLQTHHSCCFAVCSMSACLTFCCFCSYRCRGKLRRYALITMFLCLSACGRWTS